MLEEDLLYVLALQRAKGIGDINAKKLIAHCGSAKKVFKEKRRIIKDIFGFGTISINNLSRIPKNYQNLNKQYLKCIILLS